MAALTGCGAAPTPDRSARPSQKPSDGRLWFFPLEGLSVIDPRRLLSNTLPPLVQIEQISADGQIYPPASEVRLPSLIRDLEMDYTALSFVAPEKVMFRTKLEGHDREWHDVGNRRQAFYTNLRPGSYRFRVMASNNSGVWNEAGAALDFSVAPAYYQTTWFAVLSITALVALVWGGHRVRIRIVEKHQSEISALNERLMKAQEQERIRIAGELHDGVMQEMLAVAMMLGSAKRRIPDNSEAKATIDKAQQKLIQAGTDIRQLSHDLHPPLLQEAGLPKAVQAYCEQFSAASSIPVVCEADESVGDLSRGAALALFRIVQEALGNAAKHAAAKRITVRLTRSERVVVAHRVGRRRWLRPRPIGHRRWFGVDYHAGTRHANWTARSSLRARRGAERRSGSWFRSGDACGAGRPSLAAIVAKVLGVSCSARRMDRRAGATSSCLRYVRPVVPNESTLVVALTLD